MSYRQFALLAVPFVVLFAGCAPTNPTTSPNMQPGVASPSGEKFVLKDEPTGGKGVLKVRADAKDGEEVIVVGRIGGDQKPWVEGRASFYVVDPTLKPCAEERACSTPWDYCCVPKEELTPAMVSVKFLDEKGQVIDTDARTLLGVKELDMVVIKGKVEKSADKFVLRASGLFRRPATK